jgi:hypothetical protein
VQVAETAYQSSAAVYQEETAAGAERVMNAPGPEIADGPDVHGWRSAAASARSAGQAAHAHAAIPAITNCRRCSVFMARA